jgi:hypothetical protein
MSKTPNLPKLFSSVRSENLSPKRRKLKNLQREKRLKALQLPFPWKRRLPLPLLR